MAKEAESHAADDKIRREQIEAKNQLDSMIYNVEKMLRDHGDKIRARNTGRLRIRSPMPRESWSPPTSIKWTKLGNV